MKKIYTRYLPFLLSIFFMIPAKGYEVNDNGSEAAGDVVVYLVRHGKTYFNTSGRVQGWSDTPLTPEGVQVAEDLGRGLKDTTFVSIYSSDSGRARETAQLVRKYNKDKDTPIQETTDLREWFFGSFEGELGSVMYSALAKALGASDDDDSRAAFKSRSIAELADGFAAADPDKAAENWNDIKTRVERALNNIVSEVSAKGGGNVLVVCHGLTISSILYIIDPAFKGVGLENASVSMLKCHDGQCKIASYNDVSFLKRGALER